MLEFVTWFVWLGLFAMLQRRICRSFPGIRSACRRAFFATTIIAILPAFWVLLRTPLGAPQTLQVLNHYFGIGVYAQMSIQALIQLRWLAASPLGFALAVRGVGVDAGSERELLAKMNALSRAVRTDSCGPRSKD